jgi:hypothetical protein
LQAQVANLGRPSNRALRFFRRWFHGESRDLKGRKPFAIIDSEATKMLDDEDDLAALKVPEEDDRLSQLLRDHWPLQVSACAMTRMLMFATHSFGETWQELRDSTRYFRLRHVTRTVAIVNTLFAAVELVGAITILYFVQSPKARIGLIACFTSLFGISLCLLMNARKGEIFGASTAYAAVLVVFVSGDLGGSTAATSGGSGVG